MSTPPEPRSLVPSRCGPLRALATALLLLSGVAVPGCTGQGPPVAKPADKDAAPKQPNSPPPYAPPPPDAKPEVKPTPQPEPDPQPKLDPPPEPRPMPPPPT